MYWWSVFDYYHTARYGVDGGRVYYYYTRDLAAIPGGIANTPKPVVAILDRMLTALNKRGLYG